MSEVASGTRPAWLERLNPEQRQAVEHFLGPILVLAGAGSGKTRVLTTRIAWLVHEHGVDPASILAVTFTNKAANEMRERVKALLGAEPAGLWMGTFHSIGARLLRRHAALLGFQPNFTIADADQSLREIKRTMERLGISDKEWHPQAIQSAISNAANRLVSPEDYERLAADRFTGVVARVYTACQASLKEQNAFGFDDLLVAPVRLFEQEPVLLDRYRRRFRFILVDEYQDTNYAQHWFLGLLAGEHRNLMVVGDEDQSIYGWRGADVRNILEFERSWPGARVVRLEQNYRSTRTILDVANQAIAPNTQRHGKTLRTEAGVGDRVTRVEALDERDEAAWVGGEVLSRSREPGRRLRDFTVLYRTNAQSRAFEEAFRLVDLPYQIVGGTRFYERREIMDVLAYLRLISNPRDAGAFERTVNYPRRGIGDASQGKLLAWAAQRGLSPLDAAARAREIPELHGSAVQALRTFADLIQRYSAMAQQMNVAELLERLLTEIAITDALDAEGPEGKDRIDNVRELVAGASAFVATGSGEEYDPDAPDAPALSSLDLYLQKISLLTDIDRHDAQADAVTLMTLHNAKGLEFTNVFITGLEDGLFPLLRARDEPDDMEEERRLFYVGITRARRKLYLLHARSRRRAGEVVPCKASGFLDPLSRELVDHRTTPALERARLDYSVRERTGGGWSGSPASRPAPRSGTPFESDGVYIDYTDAQDVPRFLKGERVRHPQFGRGVIRELSGFGQDLKVVIEFEGIGRKKVSLRHANLQKEL